MLWMKPEKRTIQRIRPCGMVLLLCAWSYLATAQIVSTHLSEVGQGWSRTMVNACIFRAQSVISYKSHQYIAYYNEAGHVVLGKRKLGTDTWVLNETTFTGHVEDAHNVISIMIDGKGYLHMAWDHHGNALHYAKSLRPESTDMGKSQPMTGAHESNVTYPEFYSLPSGDLLFAYRDGSSGNGNLVLNRYSVKKHTWSRLHSNLIDGEGARNAYWQMYVSPAGVIHISWVWRETWHVETNHDMCYAVSQDEGKTWQTSAGHPYTLPITQATAEYALHIPQNSDLINQTSMTADANEQPYIVTYFQAEGDVSPQYYMIYCQGNTWKSARISDRTEDFDLAGGGSRSIPISRPKVLFRQNNTHGQLVMVFRDEARGGGASITCVDLPTITWNTVDLTDFSLDRWEPSYDPALWHKKGVLHLYVQKVGQESGERAVNMPPQPVYVLEAYFKKP